MGGDVIALIGRDHDELDCVLDAMHDRRASPEECAGLLHALRVSFMAHAAAQGLILQRLVDDGAASPRLRDVVAKMFDEHRQQSLALASFATHRLGTNAWFLHARKLRDSMRDHASGHDALRAALLEHASADALADFANDYATKRLRCFGVLTVSSSRVAAMS